MDVKLTSIPVCADGIKTRNESFGMLLVSKRTPILTLNDDSTAIWRKLDGARDVSSIITELKNEYDCPENELRDTVISFLDSCYKLGLIEFQ